MLMDPYTSRQHAGLHQAVYLILPPEHWLSARLCPIFDENNFRKCFRVENVFFPDADRPVVDDKVDVVATFFEPLGHRVARFSRLEAGNNRIQTLRNVIKVFINVAVVTFAFSISVVLGVVNLCVVDISVVYDAVAVVGVVDVIIVVNDFLNFDEFQILAIENANEFIFFALKCWHKYCKLYTLYNNAFDVNIEVEQLVKILEQWHHL